MKINMSDALLVKCFVGSIYPTSGATQVQIVPTVTNSNVSTSDWIEIGIAEVYGFQMELERFH